MPTIHILSCRHNGAGTRCGIVFLNQYAHICIYNHKQIIYIYTWYDHPSHHTPIFISFHSLSITSGLSYRWWERPAKNQSPAPRGSPSPYLGGHRIYRKHQIPQRSLQWSAMLSQDAAQKSWVLLLEAVDESQVCTIPITRRNPRWHNMQSSRHLLGILGQNGGILKLTNIWVYPKTECTLQK